MAGELLLSTMRHIWATLAALKVDAALMGGIAVAAWRHLRNTRDVDVLIGVALDDAERLANQLRSAGFKTLREPAVLHLGDSRILQLSYEPPGRFMEIRVDLFLAESEFHRNALARRREMAVGPDDPVFIVSCEDLILFKLMAGRLIDRSDAAYLLRFNRAELDLDYVREWARRLTLERLLGEVWSEAFPGERS